MRQSPLTSLFATLSCVFSVCSARFFSSNKVSSVLAWSALDDDAGVDVESPAMLENSSDFITLQHSNAASHSVMCPVQHRSNTLFSTFILIYFWRNCMTTMTTCLVVVQGLHPEKKLQSASTRNKHSLTHFPTYLITLT